jgi:hypothetical protein
MDQGVNRRRSERVMLRMSVLVLAEDEERHLHKLEAQTQVVNAHGGLFKIKTHLHVGQSFILSNPRSAAEISCQVVRIEDAGLEYFHVAFEFDRPAPDFWPIVFPPTDWVASQKV